MNTDTNSDVGSQRDPAIATNEQASADVSTDVSVMVRYGISEELLALFDGLRETQGPAGLKFRHQDVNAVVQSVVCRNYGKSCLELSYLLWAIIHRDQQHHCATRHSPLLDFFWLSPDFSPAGIRSFFSQESHGETAVTVEQQGLRLDIGGSEFVISPTRVGYLAVLFELLINVDPGIIALGETQLKSGAVRDIKSLSSELQKRLYEFLNQHLQPAQQQRRFRLILAWLQSRADGRPLTELITDPQILSFWQQMAVADTTGEEASGLGFKRYRTVAENFITFVQAYQSGQQLQQVDHATAIGIDHVQGEIHPEHLDQLLSAISEQELDIDWLATDPKFITKQQLNLLQPLANCQWALRQLPITLARMQLFGDWQAEIVQASRGKDPQQLLTKLASTDVTSYAEYLEQLDGLAESLAKVVLAIVDILVESRQPQAVPMLLAALDKGERQQVYLTMKEAGIQLDKGGDSRDTEGRLRQLGEMFFAQLAPLKLQCPGLNRRCQLAAKAFKANNRQGFKNRPDTEHLDDYLRGQECLEQVARNLALYQHRLPQALLPGDLAENFAADFSIFKNIFSIIHGDRHGK